MGFSWWATMTQPQVQLTGATSPWRGGYTVCLRSFPQSVQVGGLAAVLPVTGLYLHSAESDQITERPLYRGPGKSQVPGDGADGVPALAIPIGPVVKIETYRFCSGG